MYMELKHGACIRLYENEETGGVLDVCRNYLGDNDSLIIADADKNAWVVTYADRCFGTHFIVKRDFEDSLGRAVHWGSRCADSIVESYKTMDRAWGGVPPLYLFSDVCVEKETRQ